MQIENDVDSVARLGALRDPRARAPRAPLPQATQLRTAAAGLRPGRRQAGRSSLIPLLIGTRKSLSQSIKPSVSIFFFLSFIV